MEIVETKLKLCEECKHFRKIFRNTEYGPQCMYCYRREMAEEVRNQKYKPIRRSTKNKKVNINPPRKNTIDEIDKKFSLVIRLMHSEGTGDSKILKCYTCDKMMTFGEAQCGHFIPRANMTTRWLVDNCRPQCTECNEHEGGNIYIFEERLEQETPGSPDKLRALGRTLSKFSDSDLSDISSSLTKELKDRVQSSR